MSTEQERVAEAIRAFEAGEIVVVTDDDDRENEGDLVIAASLCTPEKMAFIIRHTCGIVCTPMTRADARRLKLDAMVADNDSPHGTAFTVTIDYRHGTTTGISAEDRTATARALANGNCGAEDFVRPGHIFPLVAKEGGVLMRSGHTEAAVDLCTLAGLPPVGVICELVNDDGTVKKGRDVTDFAEEHGLKVLSVAELIAYRQRNERLVERVAQSRIDTFAGPATAITYATPWDRMQHLAIVFGDIRDGNDVPVRLHLESVLEDVFDGSHVRQIVERIAKGGRGVVIYLREGAVGVSRSSERARPHSDGDDHGSASQRSEEWREIGLGAQILNDLGVNTIRLITSRERHYVGLSGYGIDISSTDIIE